MLRNKIDALNVIIEEIKPQVAVYVEHGMHKNILNISSPANFELCASYCRKEKSWGGVAVFVHKDVSHFVSEVKWISECSSEGFCEMAGITVNFDNLKMLIMGIYRPPTKNTDAFFSILIKILSNLSKTFDNILIIGDFNLNILVNSLEIKNLHDLTNSFNLFF